MRAEFSLDYDVLTVERPQKIYLMARFASGPAPGDATRRPLNLSLVIDRSGSMAGDKIDYTRQAAQFLVQHLNLRDRLSVVLYNDRVQTLVKPQPIERKDDIVQLIDGIRVSGTTNLSGGWLEGCQHVRLHHNAEQVNRVILMSDGLANRGVTDMDQLVTMARQRYDNEGVSTTTMGLGRDFNEELLMAMSDAGGGAFYFIESPEAAPAIFREELTGLLNLVGQNLIIALTPTDHVTTVRQLNAYPEHVDGRMTAFRLGDVFGEEVKTLVLEIDVPALQKLGQQQIAQLRFDYDEILPEGGTEHRVHEMPVIVNIQSAEQPRQLSDPSVQQSVLLLRAANARREAVAAADKGQYVAAAERLRGVARDIEAAHLDDVQLKEERDALLNQAARMDRGAAGYDVYSRKTLSTQSWYTMTSRHDETVVLRQRERERQDQDPNERETGTFGQVSSPTQADDAPGVIAQPGVVPTRVQWQDQTFELKGDLIRIGRASHNEIIVKERGISRFHAQIRREGGRLLLEDLGSTNGTTLGGEPLRGPHDLSVGDVVYLCDEKLVFRD